MLAVGVWAAPSVLRLDRVAAAVPSRPYVPFYEENFQGALGGPNVSWSTVQTDVAPADPNRRFLGQFNNDTVTLRLQGLPPHVCLCVEFDFYAIQSWDGEHPSNGRDALNVSVDGALLFDETSLTRARRLVKPLVRRSTTRPKPMRSRQERSVKRSSATASIGYGSVTLSTTHQPQQSCSPLWVCRESPMNRGGSTTLSSAPSDLRSVGDVAA